MPVHHATVKLAAKFGIILTGDSDSATAQHPSSGVVIEGADGKFVLAACRIASRLKLEYPMLEVEFDEDTTEGNVTGPDGESIYDIDMTEPVDVDKVIAEIIEAAQDAAVNLDGEEDDEEEARGNVVPEKYKIEYTARGNRDHCGDWLALQLEGKFRKMVPDNKNDVFDAEAFLDFLSDNGVDITGKWADLRFSGAHGWAGRFRMNGRQKLEKRLAVTGILILGNRKVNIPSEDWAILKAKHPVKEPKKAKTETKPAK